MKPIDIKSNTHIDSSQEINNKDPKFKICDIVWISKYKNIFAKGFTQIGLKKFLWLKKLKILYHGHMLSMILTEKKFFERFTKINYKKTNQKKFTFKKVIKRKGDKLYVK